MDNQCKYCLCKKDIIVNESPSELAGQPNRAIIMGDGIVLLRYGSAFGYMDINFCPMCGKKLK